ncbi:GntR family transcriptional regulator [Hoyosella sp. G463]|uniref:GntR family transcriptional regulator n=1 Tax=Lolliginicoccus lacisalsi TaxID=2742202 RepID=A0A927PLK5_9ACTN|nr:GntR family transcriptional regulator [Lolliginicoccus lacisalsi]MBD8505477.1 GntR family transcriptional regulator [Lolliginicoccus lacisalsi]
MDDGKPLFQQVAELVEGSIIDGSLNEEEQAPSTNELAAFHHINPATAAKGLNQLVTTGVLYKKRGIGMFVAPGARDRLRGQRREQFARAYIAPLLAEARRIGIAPEELRTMLDHREDQDDRH